MRDRKGIFAATVVVLFIFLFIAYRARTFHYCASTGDRPEARITDGSEPCGPDQEPLEWRRVGWAGKIKLAAGAAAKVLGAN